MSQGPVNSSQHGFDEAFSQKYKCIIRVIGIVNWAYMRRSQTKADESLVNSFFEQGDADSIVESASLCVQFL